MLLKEYAIYKKKWFSHFKKSIWILKMQNYIFNSIFQYIKIKLMFLNKKYNATIYVSFNINKINLYFLYPVRFQKLLLVKTIITKIIKLYIL